MNKINNNDVFLQIKEPVRGELKIKGSRFIAIVKKVTSEDEANLAITKISREFHVGI